VLARARSKVPISQPMFVAAQFTGLEGKYVKRLKIPCAASRKSWKASTTTFRRQAFYMVARSTKRLQGREEKASA